MKKNQDAYGQEIWEYYKTGNSIEIVERDDGYMNVTPWPIIYFNEYNKWPKQDKIAVKYAKGRVLDIGCGAGRHSLYLQGKGHDVLGIDNSPLAIKVCKERGLKKAKILAIEDVKKLPKGAFDTITMLGNNFGLVGSFNKAKRILKAFYCITSQDGIIVAQASDPYGTDYKPHLDYHKRNRKKGRMTGQLKIRIRHNQYVGKWFDYLFVSEKELKSILKDTGWEIRKLYKDKSPQYIMVLGKG